MTFLRTLALVASAATWATFALGEIRYVDLGRVPEELGYTEPAMGKVQALSRWKAPSVTMQSLQNGHLRVSIPGAETLVVSGAPELPSLTKRVRLAEGTSAVAVLENPIMEESTEPVSLEKVSEPLSWHSGKKISFGHKSRGRYFPGTFIRSREEGGVLSVTVYPVQFDTVTNKLVTLRQADIQLVTSARTRVFNFPVIFAPTSIILTSEAMVKGAERLKDFHSEALGLESEIVYVEDIAKSESAIAEEDLPDGYKSMSDRDARIVKYDANARKGYDYVLARKIISYLRVRMASGSPTKYVTILGDSALVPPSYYFSVGEGFSKEVGVTDQCYAALDHCLDPRLAVGRLPFHSADEVTPYLEKVKRWMRDAESLPSELSLYGGKAFPGDMYVGELGTARVVNFATASWRGLKRNYRTRGNYSKPAMLEMAGGKRDSAFVYHLDHGDGNEWYVEDDYVTSNEVIALPEASAVTPFVASIACTNAAFDSEIVNQPIFSKPSDGKESVGVSLVRSKAGAVAYLGSARPALGNPVYHVDQKGNLILTDSTFGLKLLDTFYQRYHDARGGVLGDHVLGSLRDFAKQPGEGLEEDSSRYSYFNLALLGDPALRLPRRLVQEKNLGMPSSTTAFDGMMGGYPALRVSAGQSAEVTIESAETVTVKLFKRMLTPFGMSAGEKEIASDTLSKNGAIQIPQSEEGVGGSYFLKIENTRGVPMERQVWFNVSEKE